MRKYIIIGFGKYYAGHEEYARWTERLDCVHIFDTREEAAEIAKRWAKGLVQISPVDPSEFSVLPWMSHS